MVSMSSSDRSVSERLTKKPPKTLGITTVDHFIVSKQKHPLSKCLNVCYQQLAASEPGHKLFPQQCNPIKQHTDERLIV